MGVYIFLFILISVLCIKYDFNNNIIKTSKYKPFFLVCLTLSLIGGLRYHIGSDTANYIEQFEYIPTIKDFFKIIELENLSQPLWYLTNSIGKTIVDDFIIIQILHSFIVNFLIGRFIFKTCEKPFIAILAYTCCIWWNFNFEIMRESLCVAIYLNIYNNYLQNNNIKKFLLHSIPIMLIHYFAFIPIIFTFIIHFFKYRSFLLGGIVVTFILYFKISEGMLMKYMLLIEGVMESDGIERAMKYLESDQLGFVASSVIGISFVFITQVFYSFLISKDKKIDERVAKILLLYSFIIILRLKLLILVRFINYWQIILIVYAINYFIINKRNIYALYIKTIFVYSIYMGISNFLSPTESDNSKYDCRYIPYSSYLDKTIHQKRESLFY